MISELTNEFDISAEDLKSKLIILASQQMDLTSELIIFTPCRMIFAPEVMI